MKFAVIAARLLFGLPLVAFGLMGVFQVMPDPQAFWNQQEGFAPEAADFLVAMWDSGFLMHCVVAIHLVSGILVLINRYVPLALVIHLPISVVMVLFHAMLDPASGALAYLIFALNLFLLGVSWETCRPLLAARS